MKIKLAQVIFAVESASEAFQEYFDTQTGQSVALADPDITGERDEELADLIINFPGRFLPFPSKYEIHEYRIMADFVDELRPGAAPELSEARARSAGSRTASAIIAWNSNGTIIWPRPSGRLPFAGVRKTIWNMRKTTPKIKGSMLSDKQEEIVHGTGSDYSGSPRKECLPGQGDGGGTAPPR